MLTKNFNIFCNANGDADADATVSAIALPAFSYRPGKNVISHGKLGSRFATLL